MTTPLPTQTFPLNRETLSDARNDRLFFAQVREDPLVELQALQVRPTDRCAIISSGGCTALSVLAEGAGEVVAVDLNRSQNHLVELKAAAVATLAARETVCFLGGWQASERSREKQYAVMRPLLSDPAARYWDQRVKYVRNGVLSSGRSEQFLSVAMFLIRHFVHSDARIRRLFATRTLEEQRRYYDSEWNNRRWRLLLRTLVNRASFRKTLHPSFFEHVENPSFAKYFQGVIEHVMAEVPVGNNYFFHQIMTGFYANERDEQRPPYLQESRHPALQAAMPRLNIVDGSFGAFLETQADASIDVFSLSNIFEWMDATAIDDLFGEIVRTAAPGARMVFRNFVGWTEIPERHRDRIVENRELGDRLIARDRSGMQRRAAVCTFQ